MVFVFETGDVAVGHREIQQCKEAGVLPHVEMPCTQHLARDAVPPLGRTLIPIAADLALLGSPRGTLASTDRLDFFKVCKSAPDCSPPADRDSGTDRPTSAQTASRSPTAPRLPV